MKKIFIFAMTLGILLCAKLGFCATAQVANATALPGAPAAVTISMSGNTNPDPVAGVDLWLVYDRDLLDYVSASKGSLVSSSDWGLFANATQFNSPPVGITHANIVKIAIFASSPGFSDPSGTLAVVNFTVKSTATPGTISDLILNLAQFNGVAVGKTNGKFTVASLPNHPPVLNPIGDKVIKDGSRIFSFQVSATDADANDTLTYSVNHPLPPGASFDPPTKTFSWLAKASPDEKYQVTFTVTDGHGGSDSEMIFLYNCTDNPDCS